MVCWTIVKPSFYCGHQKLIDAWPLPLAGAGDSFRAAFAVCVVEERPEQECLQFAAAAGAVAVSRLGAVPSLPTRKEVGALLPEWLPTGAAAEEGACSNASGAVAASSDDLPAGGLKFASRLNSMKQRLDLWAGANSVAGWVARQGSVRGLDLVDLNHPQHTDGHSPEQLREALRQAGLAAGAICMRFPSSMRLGAFSNPDPSLRQAAVDLAVQGCQWARHLGAGQVVVWSATDGYDYHFQVDYGAAWLRVVESFQQLCDRCPDLRVSLEWKPTDESSRFSLVPSTGAALLLTDQVRVVNFVLPCKECQNSLALPRNT